MLHGQRGFHMLSPMEVIDDSKETAASWATEHIALRPDFGWIVGRYVEADKPNRNGHIFPLEDLRAAHGLVVHTPLNMLHRAHHVIGTFTATELLAGVESAIPFAASEQAAMLNSHVEALAAVWRYAFPDEYRAVQSAFRERSAWLSMEAVPRTITCAVDNLEFAYKGPVHDSYCEHLRASPRARRRLNQPHFVGGATIIPPTRPGWANADIRDIAGVIEKHLDEAEMVYDKIAADAPHLDSTAWTELMAVVLAKAHGGEPAPLAIAVARDVSGGEREKLAKEGKAMPDGSFPIANESDLRNAISAYGRAKNRAAAKRHIMKRARALGLEDLIPESWKGRETAAASIPPQVYEAYLAHLKKGGWDADEAVKYVAETYEGGVLHQVADGWGEWYFAEGADGKLRWVAQKMADVWAFHCSDEIGLTKADVKRIGWGDAAWSLELRKRLNVKRKEAAASIEIAADVLALEAQAKQTGKKGAIVALVPPPEIAEQLAALGDEPADVLHVTLAFLGDLTDDDQVELDEDDGGGVKRTPRAAVLAAVAAFCAGAPPLPTAKISGVGAFALGDDKAVVYASVDVPGLPELRERLVAALGAAGIPISRLHGLSPHISLRYTSADVAPPAADALGTLEWPVGHLEVWWSDDSRTKFDLADGKVALPA